MRGDRKAIKAYRHPGIEGAANKTYTYVLPSLRAGHRKGRFWLNSSHAAMDGGAQKGHPFEYCKAGRGTNKYTPKMLDNCFFDVLGVFVREGQTHVQRCFSFSCCGHLDANKLFLSCPDPLHAAPYWFSSNGERSG